MAGLKAYLNKDQQTILKDSVPIEMKKGYATFHHPLLVHGSFETKSAQQRRAFVLNVFVDGTYSDSDEILLADVPAFRKGEKLEGKFFPVLFDSSLELDIK